MIYDSSSMVLPICGFLYIVNNVGWPTNFEYKKYHCTGYYKICKNNHCCTVDLIYTYYAPIFYFFEGKKLSIFKNS